MRKSLLKSVVAAVVVGAAMALTSVAAMAATTTYALKEGDTFTSGQTVEVKDAAGTTVATVTYGEAGGADFTAAKKATGDSELAGYAAYTDGNGTNGNKEKGTWYTITPKSNGTVSVAVILNKDKAFYIEEDGTALENYNGKKETAKYYGTYDFAAKANKAYKVYCSGSKLAFYGFSFTESEAAEEETFLAGVLDTKPAVAKVNGKYYAILPISEDAANNKTSLKVAGEEAEYIYQNVSITGLNKSAAADFGGFYVYGIEVVPSTSGTTTEPTLAQVQDAVTVAFS